MAYYGGAIHNMIVSAGDPWIQGMQDRREREREEAMRQELASAIGPDGQIDYGVLSQKLLGGGDVRSAIAASGMRDKQRERQSEQQRRQRMMDTLGFQPSQPNGPNDPNSYTGGPSGRAAPRGLRNNNPGNIEAGSFTQRQPGFSGSDGRFAQFDSPEGGVDAMHRLLSIYRDQHGLTTPRQVINRWAPSSENNTNAYVATVTRLSGLNPDAPVDLSDPQQASRLIGAMIHMENGQNPFSREQIAGYIGNGQQPAQVAQAQPQTMTDATPGAGQAWAPGDQGQQDIRSFVQSLPPEIQSAIAARAQDDPDAALKMVTDIMLRQRGLSGAQTNINLKNIGSIPPGYRVVYDDRGNPVSMEPIPGGPAAAEAEQDAAKQTERADRREMEVDIATQEIDRAVGIIDEGGIRLPVSGFGGETAAEIGGTDAAQLSTLLDTIKAGVGFDKLQAMREASPTGGALGPVSDFENRLLQSILGSLSQKQKPEELKKNLVRLRATLMDIVHGPGNWEMGDAKQRLGDKMRGGDEVVDWQTFFGAE